MGLDMYLHKKTYVGNQYRKEEEMILVSLPDSQGDAMFPVAKGSIKNERIKEIVEEVAYWRKFNALHDWFVQNVQEGTDDCGEYWVSEENLKEIIDLCKKDLEILKTAPYHMSEELTDYFTKEKFTYEIYDIDPELLNLKPVSGFFFGSTDIDKYYKKELEGTIEQLTPLLEEKGDFYYHSSW